MALNRIVLFYVFTPLPDPEAIRLWQRTLCEKLQLRGRILISGDGINATVGGDLNAIKQYLKIARGYAGFRNLDAKFSAGSADDFPRLSVKVRDEIVSFGAPGELQVDAGGVLGGGTHLAPEELHELVAQKRASRKEVVFFDGRNAFEAQIGRFKNAVVPDVATTADFIRELDSGKYDALKDEPVVTYCTGGIRCEVLSSLMINRGFKEVYQLDGGIVRYGETFKDEGLWEGSLYVFDKRMHLEFSDQARTLGHCVRCSTPTNKFENCSNPSCRNLALYCSDCASSADTLLCPQGCSA
ncbi:rhodanese-related sulfurtransferase [Paenarthrobacter sp. Z7-10]|uniref:oxygen-dependent tRNA uridine(34) hydroxylase TrhO n=1 Tax=Paenarthrobacter sp. Z7-10 TaxID=2787635 RepID=UPI0022A9B2F6|nr:rhodanese-related sulfurtransferase [Paenarthrobacter sp. Z7-10]MCZ2401794.1 rhodanese-related sulfurtransferase [Paenarthrobacter sp. Z7-10]